MKWESVVQYIYCFNLFDDLAIWPLLILKLFFSKVNSRLFHFLDFLIKHSTNLEFNFKILHKNSNQKHTHNALSFSITENNNTLTKMLSYVFTFVNHIMRTTVVLFKSHLLTINTKIFLKAERWRV